jgi:hypothetical protein
MATKSQPDADWLSFVKDLTALEQRVRRSKAVNVNAESLRSSTRAVVESYFRAVRPGLVSLGFDDGELSVLDEEMQNLLVLSQRPNAKRTYLSSLRTARKEVDQVTASRELRIGATVTAAPGARSEIETKIAELLGRLAPEAAQAYAQALLDLSQPDRVSFRGPAHELREALRGALDRLAPDSSVQEESWFELAEGQRRPSQRQKMRFILESRGVSASARKAPDQAMSVIEPKSLLARTGYEQASAAAHTAPTKAEVQNLKMYVDVALAEILDIHA